MFCSGHVAVHVMLLETPLNTSDFLCTSATRPFMHVNTRTTPHVMSATHFSVTTSHLKQNVETRASLGTRRRTERLVGFQLPFQLSPYNLSRFFQEAVVV